MGSVCVSSIPALANVDTFLSRVKNASAVIRHRFYIVKNKKTFRGDSALTYSQTLVSKRECGP